MSEIFIITAVPANIRDYSFIASIECLKKKNETVTTSLSIDPIDVDCGKGEKRFRARINVSFNVHIKITQQVDKAADSRELKANRNPITEPNRYSLFCNFFMTQI